MCSQPPGCSWKPLGRPRGRDGPAGDPASRQAQPGPELLWQGSGPTPLNKYLTWSTDGFKAPLHAKGFSLSGKKGKPPRMTICFFKYVTADTPQNAALHVLRQFSVFFSAVAAGDSAQSIETVPFPCMSQHLLPAPAFRILLVLQQDLGEGSFCNFSL